MSGGDLIARVLSSHGLRFLFTLCGGHISPILVGAKALGIRVVDTRHEVTAVFAADAVARLTGIPGVAAVTAGPGVSNTITAIKNAQLAQSPLILLGGATATLLRGRGSLQDIDQVALIRPHVKQVWQAKRVRDLVPALEAAFRVCQEGVPGPVFVECPVDLLYPEAVVREWYGAKAGVTPKSLLGRVERRYVDWHLSRLFGGAEAASPSTSASAPASSIVPPREPPQPAASDVERAGQLLSRAARPVLVIGSQALLDPARASSLADAVRSLGVPAYLSGMARGLLGAADPLQLRHRRKEALRESDLVILAGVPCDFRLDYGRHIPSRATLISANRSRAEIAKNRRPTLSALGAPDLCLRQLSALLSRPRPEWTGWLEQLRKRDAERDAEIREQAAAPAEGGLNPLSVCAALDEALGERGLVVADGGDFVATASYVLRPRGPLTWLDPGPFGTLGVGAGFALGAKLARPDADVFAVYGDGAYGYSLAEMDTFARHQIGVVAVIGNDASWSQIARDQIEILKDDVGTALARTDYERSAEGLGARGFRVTDDASLRPALSQALESARAGVPACVNVHLGQSDFRKGSLSI